MGFGITLQAKTILSDACGLDTFRRPALLAMRAVFATIDAAGFVISLCERTSQPPAWLLWITRSRFLWGGTCQGDGRILVENQRNTYLHV